MSDLESVPWELLRNIYWMVPERIDRLHLLKFLLLSNRRLHAYLMGFVKECFLDVLHTNLPWNYDIRAPPPNHPLAASGLLTLRGSRRPTRGTDRRTINTFDCFEKAASWIGKNYSRVCARCRITTSQFLHLHTNNAVPSPKTYEDDVKDLAYFSSWDARRHLRWMFDDRLYSSMIGMDLDGENGYTTRLCADCVMYVRSVRMGYPVVDGFMTTTVARNNYMLTKRQIAALRFWTFSEKLKVRYVLLSGIVLPDDRFVPELIQLRSRGRQDVIRLYAMESNSCAQLWKRDRIVGRAVQDYHSHPHTHYLREVDGLAYIRKPGRKRKREGEPVTEDVKDGYLADVHTEMQENFETVSHMNVELQKIRDEAGAGRLDTQVASTLGHTVHFATCDAEQFLTQKEREIRRLKWRLTRKEADALKEITQDSQRARQAIAITELKKSLMDNAVLDDVFKGDGESEQ